MRARFVVLFVVCIHLTIDLVTAEPSQDAILEALDTQQAEDGACECLNDVRERGSVVQLRAFLQAGFARARQLMRRLVNGQLRRSRSTQSWTSIATARSTLPTACWPCCGCLTSTMMETSTSGTLCPCQNWQPHATTLNSAAVIHWPRRPRPPQTFIHSKSSFKFPLSPAGRTHCHWQLCTRSSSNEHWHSVPRRSLRSCQAVSQCPHASVCARIAIALAQRHPPPSPCAAPRPPTPSTNNSAWWSDSSTQAAARSIPWHTSPLFTPSHRCCVFGPMARLKHTAIYVHLLHVGSNKTKQHTGTGRSPVAK